MVFKRKTGSCNDSMFQFRVNNRLTCNFSVHTFRAAHSVEIQIFYVKSKLTNIQHKDCIFGMVKLAIFEALICQSWFHAKFEKQKIPQISTLCVCCMCNFICSWSFFVSSLDSWKSAEVVLFFKPSLTCNLFLEMWYFEFKNKTLSWRWTVLLEKKKWKNKSLFFSSQAFSKSDSYDIYIL